MPTHRSTMLAIVESKPAPTAGLATGTTIDVEPEAIAAHVKLSPPISLADVLVPMLSTRRFPLRVKGSRVFAVALVVIAPLDQAIAEPTISWKVNVGAAVTTLEIAPYTSTTNLLPTVR